MTLRARIPATIALLALAFTLTACPGNSPVKAPAKLDAGSGGVYFDGGSTVPPTVDSSTAIPPAADGYLAPPVVDYGTTSPPATGTKTCVQIFDCYETCAENDMNCYDTCFYQGSADGQAKTDALEQCEYQAEGTTCKTQCVNWQSQTCWDCLDQACATQIQACGF